MFKLPLIAAPILVLTAVATQAQAPAEPAAGQQAPTRAELVKKLDDGFNRVDTNNDGFLDSKEVTSASAKAVHDAEANLGAKIQEEFNKLDTDKNGQLTLTEFKAAAKVNVKASPEEALLRLDSNKDGRISAAEFKATTLASYDKVDLNKDGKITPDEAAKASQSR